MLLWREVPVWRRQVEAGDISAGLIKLVITALFDDIAFIVKSNDMIAVWQTLGYGAGDISMLFNVWLRSPAYLKMRQSRQ